MAEFLNGIQLANRARRFLGNFTEKSASFENIQESFVYDEAIDGFDLFLSHRYVDKDAVAGLALMLREDYNLKIYVDWQCDNLNRKNVNSNTARIIRERITQSKAMLYVISDSSQGSNWMPWEVGVMDGLKGRVAVCPLLVSQNNVNAIGLEYLSLYPYVSNEKDTKGEAELWINETESKYCSLTEWINGKTPKEHIKEKQ